MPIRHAATVVLTRPGPDGPEVLIGQRGASAVFLPSKFVFPGGAVDTDDAGVPLGRPLNPRCADRLSDGAARPDALAAAAIREVWEETGLLLAKPGSWPGPVPPGWKDFASAGLLPDASALTYIFRAITPPGRPRRFDARFFAADATRAQGTLGALPGGGAAELSHLQWIAVSRVRRFDLAFITEVVLSEVADLARDANGALCPPETVPFFDNTEPRSEFRRLA